MFSWIIHRSWAPTESTNYSNSTPPQSNQPQTLQSSKHNNFSSSWVHIDKVKMSSHDDDLVAHKTEGYKVGEKKTVEEYAKLGT